MSKSRAIDRPAAEDMSQCVHCGFCLQQCPTYLQLGLETDSPRGRIHLIRALSEDRVEPTPTFARHLDLCLQCRACETACPSGVPFGRIMEAGRAMLVQQGRAPLSWRLRAALLRYTLPYPRRLNALFALLRFYQRSGLRSFARAALRVFPKGMRDVEGMLPDVSPRRFNVEKVPSTSGTRVRRVALLTGCVMPHLYARTHEATVRVLKRNGCEVVVPQEQRCCGALNVHAGDSETARRLARLNIDVFLSEGVEAIVVNSAGCGSTMKEYAELFRDDSGYATRARTFSLMVKDVTEFLSELPFARPMGRVPARVTYQDSCHLVHAQRVKDAPRDVLRAIPGLDLAEMSTPDRCCGSAGVYSFTQRGMSLRILDDKMLDVRSTSPDVIATANPGCMMQLEAGLQRSSQTARVVHVVELLDEAYRATDSV